jgi:hypothetical protein|tara:strand:+ start:262 stop:495 length:234 start_codon:yes stop_codon:yes gene_type:complete
MTQLKTLLLASTVVLATFFITGCENTQVSGSVSYGMGYGSGYPMYYGNNYHRHTNVVVVRPARNNRSRANVRPARRR